MTIVTNLINIVRCINYVLSLTAATLTDFGFGIISCSTVVCINIFSNILYEVYCHDRYNNSIIGVLLLITCNYVSTCTSISFICIWLFWHTIYDIRYISHINGYKCGIVYNILPLIMCVQLYTLYMQPSIGSTQMWFNVFVLCRTHMLLIQFCVNYVFYVFHVEQPQP